MNRACARAREMLKPFGKKTNTAKRALRVLAVPLAACALMFGATSASADQAVPFSNHTVQTVNPTGTTVNLFDYWVVNGDNDSSKNINNDNKNDNTGINKDHQLKFNGGAGSGINKWTGKSDIGGFGRLSFVKNTLVKGYPSINAGTYTSYNTHGTYKDESLDYLFNNDSQANKKQNGKAVYNNVQGLFQLKDGYYVYDSYGFKEGNYAVYNSTTNSFDVYDKAGVYKESVSEENRGQFFPFDSAKKVFTESGKNLSPIGIKDGENDKLNHHFGMSMTTEFVQPANGKTNKNEDMIFEFSGDDDVWVYIDGVLVGDLGGIHEKATLDINFATGEVKVGHIDGANGTEREIEKTTIKAKFDAVGADTTNFSGDTFNSSTKHKLSFFYLERGAGASNMSLKFNLTTLPSSEVQKVDQNGEAVQGATFALYQSGESWKTQGDPIAQGTTDDKGQLVLLESDGSVLSFDNQHAAGHDFFVLKEMGLPEGYRSSLTSSTSATPGELHLQYKPAAASGTGGVVVAPQTTVKTADDSTWKGSRMWLNGGYLAAKETISLSKDIKDNKDNPISSGTTFAVVLKRTNENLDQAKEDAWTAVTGNPLDGYKLCSAHGIAGAVEAAKSADTSVFAVNTKGDYEVTVRSLPGDIEKYAAMMEDKSNADYTVAVYHTTASSLAGATIDNTSMVQYQTINRQFSTVIHLTNVQNRLFVQKVDDLGKPVNDATFQLYQAKDVTGNSPSTYAIKPGAEPYDTVKANDATYPYEIKGAACFPLDSVNHKPLIKGTYYLRESVSPDGYEINNTITKVIVDDSGVYVDAGEKGDGVLSVSGPGSLIASLAQFGSPDSIDNTLTHIKGKLQSAAVDASGNLTWGPTSPTDNWMHMRYDKTTQGAKTVLRYVEDGGDRNGQLATIFADTGINRMALYQDDDATNGTDLGTLQLNHLFTTATAVQYTDRRVARLQVTKTVTVTADSGLTAPTKDAKGNDLTFKFKFTLPESQEGYEAHVFDASGKAVGNSFRLMNGDTHSIKAGETIRVYDLMKGDSYSVSELTTKGEESGGNVLASIVNTVTGSADESVLPAGFSLVSRKAGGVEQTGTGNTITGKIGKLEGGEIPASNKLEFTNNYSASSVTLDAKDRLSVKKRLNGRDWNDSDTFTVQLTADDGVPMPNGAKSKVSTVEITEKAPTAKFDDTTYKTATFGDITYFKPGTYIYTISEVIPGSDARADGISYSAAVYTATVVVEDNQAGALVVTSVKVMQVRDDAGAETKKEVTDKVATFTNRYDEYEKDITIHAKKNLTDNARTLPLTQNTFGFTLEGMGGYKDANATFSPDTIDTSIEAPMPQGTEGNTATVGNNADGEVRWPAISYTVNKDAGHAYVYTLTENKPTENSGSVAGVTYDESVYYAVVRNVAKGAGIQTSVEYYKAETDGTVKQLDENDTPVFTNIYSVEPTSVTLQGQKTVSGRDWNQGESYTFNLAAATDDAGVTGLNKTTAQAVADGAVAINASQAVASAPEPGRVASFAFGTEAAPTVTFNRAGTFSFNITENAAQDGQPGMSMDKHTARATVVVTDLDKSGNHTGNQTGKLRVSSVTYANAGASDADKAVTDKAAFTNAYHASGTFGGVTVSKTLEGRASTAGQFAFTVTGLWYNGVQTSVDGSEASLSNTAAGASVSGAVVGASGQEKLFARTLTEQDLGHTFAYRIQENQPAAAGYAYDTGYTGDAIVLVKVLARKDDPAKLYTVTTVLKGAGVTELLGDGADASALTDEKIVQLKQDSTTYVQQYDASEAGATTPTVSFVNRYTASLDYGAAGGLWIEKTLTYPKDATVFGSPKSTFRYIVKPADKTSASKVGISTDGKVFETANVEANALKTVSLVPAGGLKFTQDDAGKTFTYTVAEIDDKATGYTYDKTVHTVKAVVADNGDGTLRVTTSVSKPGDDGKDELEGQWIYPSDATSTGVATVKFKNTYTVTEAATYTPSVTKVVVGRDAEDKFTFAMTAADDVTKAAIDGKLITGSSMSAENGYAEKKQTKEGLKDGEHYQLDFSKLTFNKPGTYKFAINEVAANSGLGEWKYDQHVYTVTVTVTDEGGKLVARADGTTGSEGFIFTNSYQTSTSYELQGGLEIVKTLNGRDLHAGMFGFTVTGEDDASIEKLNKLLRADEGELTVTNDEPQADGTSHTGILGGLTFATGDADKTFAYKIVENGGGRGGYTYDSTYWKVEIAVKKRDNGSLYTVTTVKHFDADKKELSADEKNSEKGPVEAQVSFTNSYAASGTFEGLHAQKVMDSGDKIKADQYTFDLYAEKADGGSLVPMDEGTTQASDNGIATVDFGKVDFKLGGALGGSHELTIDLAGAVKDGVATKQHNADHTTTYSFNLVAKERLVDLPEGVRPVDTSATCRVLLEVTDNNDGTLTSKVTYRDGTENGKIVFHNTRDKVKTIGTVAEPSVDIDGQLLSVGDSYVYTINWVNTEADANVTVTDKLPAGVVFEAFEGECADKGAASGQSLTWDLGKQPAGSHGSVRVRVKITEDAVEDAQGAVGTVKNAATITVGNKSYTGTTTNYVPKKSESDAQDSTGSGVKLGDELTYTIGYKNTENAPATVTITDAVPAGTEFMEFAGGHKDVGSKGNNGNLTWTLANVPAGEKGTVQFKVRVTEDAFKSGGASGNISNQASVTVGNNPAVKTNTTTDDVSDGRLTLSKTVKTAEGITAPNKAFTFKVLLYQADGTTPLAGTFAYAGRPSGTNGTYVSGQIKSGDTIALKAGGSVTVTLPIGAHYEVQELDSKGELMTSEDGFAVVDKANSQKGTVGQATQVGFTNVYSVESTKVENAFKVQKKISGRNWMTSDAFTMTLTAQGEAPMPKGVKDGVSTIGLHKDAQVGNFGTIEYTKPGTYTYVITEQSGDEAALTFSKATYRATVTVTDNGAGKLSAKTKIAQLTDDAGDAVERTVEAAVFTNTAKTGSLTVKKTVVGGDSQREFGFAVTLTDGDGEPVSGTFGKGEHAVTFTGGKATFTLKDGEEKTIAGLPVGARYTVTEDAAEGYTTTAEGAEGTVTDAGATAAFTNTYGTATEGRDVSTAGLFTKTLKGRDWAESDSFQFTLTGEDDAPMPEGSADGSKTVSVTAAGTKAGDRVAFDFGSIRYTLDDLKDAGFAEVGGKRVRAKTFTYTVSEARPADGSALAGVAYDGHAATMTVTVTDDGSGNLTASTPAIAQASGGDFVNTYTTELDYSARAGVLLSKTLSGRAMEAGQFAFTVTADAETAARLGLKTGKDAYTVSAADDGEANLIDLIGGAAKGDVTFTDADAGKTYSFTVTETKLGGEGYTNDAEPRAVTIAPAYDAATGKLTVTTTVVKDGVEVARSEVSTADDATALPAPVTVAFQNSYEATGTLGGEGDVTIDATKTLTGRAAAAGEFKFSVRDARGSVVATASNRASGDGEAAGLTFSPIAYTTDALERMVADGAATKTADGSWTIPYTVSEDTAALPAGVTATASSFDITVKVTDNGKGGLDVVVTYPEGSDGTLSFVNGYGTNEATVDLAGTKTLALGQAGLGLTQADIEGKYTFKIEPLDGAPAPVDASGKTVTEAVNDAAGNVELGHVTFKQPSDLDDVEIDGDGLRTKTFAYRVSESGSVDGVVNDATATKTFTVRVVEDTNAGTLAAEVLPTEGAPEGKGAFEFTNTYGVNPTPSSVTDQIKVGKKLEGRDLAEGEFEFQLVEIAADGSEGIAATGRNAADGTVALSPVTYTAPGTHGYELREVAGTAGGVTYDRATYRVRTTVTDAKNGTLTVRHELADAEGNPTGGDSVTFTNGYEAAPVTLKLGAAKVLKGAELKAGQFSFELKSRDGKVMSTAKNAADGSVTFDALTFKQAGTYTFTVSEVDDGQAHVTYDKAVHKIVVTVSDEAADGSKTGYLSAKVSYEGDANLPPVFTNSYAEEPGTPRHPGEPRHAGRRFGRRFR